MIAVPFIRLRLVTKKAGQCSAASCLAPLDWYRTEHDKAMPMNRGAEAGRVEFFGDDPIGTFNSADSHWATCPARQQFSHRLRR